VITNNNNNNNNIPNTHNLAKTIRHKQNKYQELANEICAMWKQKAAQVILIVWLHNKASGDSIVVPIARNYYGQWYDVWINGTDICDFTKSI